MSNRPRRIRCAIAKSSRRRAMPDRFGMTRSSLTCGLPAITGAADGSTTYAMCASGNRRRSARRIGVVNATSPIRRSRTRRIRGASGFDRGLVNEHHRDVVPDGIHAFALIALERGAIVDEFYRGLAVRTGQDFEQFGVNRHATSIRVLAGGSDAV